MGYLVAVLVVAAPTFLAVVAPRRTPLLARLSFWAALVVNEVPLYPALWLGAATALAVADGTARAPAGVVAAVVAAAAVVGLGVVLRRGLAARPALVAALGEAGFADAAARVRRSGTVRRVVGALLAPVVLPGRGLTVRRDVAYGPHGARNLLDTYRRRAPSEAAAPPAPVLVYLHGGGYFGGRKDREAALLLARLARAGWVCVSATYRVRPEAGFVEHLADLDAVLAWVDAHADDLGADPSRLVLAGSSAGAHLASVAVLRGDARAARARAVVGLYGYFGHYYGLGSSGGRSTNPAELAGPAAPPFVVLHGGQDTYVPAAGARRLVQALRRSSSAPVVYAELPGAQHGFDLFRSPRMVAVVDAVAAVLEAVVGADAGAPRGR